MTTYYVNSNSVTTYTVSTAYSLGEMVRPSSITATSVGTYEVTVAGTSAATEPSWPSSGTVVSGGVTFTYRSGSDGWTKPVGSLTQLTNRITGTKLVDGDVVLVAYNHVEDGGATNYTIGGQASGIDVTYISVDPADNTYRRGATFSLTANGTLTYNLPTAFGFDFDAAGTGPGTGQVILALGSGISLLNQEIVDCTFEINTNQANSFLRGGNTSTLRNRLDFLGCWVKFGASTQYVYHTSGQINWYGGGISSGGTAPSTFLGLGESQTGNNVIGADLSQGANPFYPAGSGSVSNYCIGDVVFIGCKMPATGITASPSSTAYNNTRRVVVRGYSGDLSKYAMWPSDESAVVSDTTRYKSAIIDGTSVSWKVTTGNGSNDAAIVEGEWIAHYLTAGTYTATMSTLVDAAAGLTHDECHLEIMYPYSATEGLLDFTSSMEGAAPNDTVTAGDAASWTKDTAVTGWIAQDHSVTFTTVSDGYIYWRFMAHGEDLSFYVDPYLSVV